MNQKTVKPKKLTLSRETLYRLEGMPVSWESMRPTSHLSCPEICTSAANCPK